MIPALDEIAKRRARSCSAARHGGLRFWPYDLQILLRRAALLLRNVEGIDLDPDVAESIGLVAGELNLPRSEVLQTILRDWLITGGRLPVDTIDLKPRLKVFRVRMRGIGLIYSPKSNENRSPRVSPYLDAKGGRWASETPARLQSRWMR